MQHEHALAAALSAALVSACSGPIVTDPAAFCLGHTGGGVGILATQRSLHGRFLRLTVPVFLGCAALFLLVQLQLRRVELQAVHALVAQRQLERDAALLSQPLWNLDVAGMRAVVESARVNPRLHCVRLQASHGLVRPLEDGDCAALGGLQRFRIEVVHRGGTEAQTIGVLEHWADTGVESAVLWKEALPLVSMLLLLMLALVICVVVVFRRIIIAPLRRVSASIRHYHASGERLPVAWSSQDELGAFIKEYNDGLDRQRTAEAELQQRLQLQTALNHTLPLPMLFLDRDFRIVENNPAFRRAFPAPSAERALPEALIGLDRAALAALRLGEVHVSEVTVTDGRSFVLSASAVPGAEAGVRGWLLALQDVSARIENERALRAAVAETQQALDALRAAQSSLVQSEKLASLGSVVAGIAHEVNTPVGSSLTVASALAGEVREFRAELASGGLRRSRLDAFVAAVAEAADILQRGLHKAADQIARFKQVAADQTSSTRRQFDLAQTVEDVLSTLRPMLRRTPHQVRCVIAAGIEMNSYPGPLGQVITNAFTNALVHGLEDHPQGCIEIRAEVPRPGWVRLTITDNGRGIPAEHLARVFDPFFTTKLGRGGTGLGLNLVYGIVSGLLGGHVECHSKLGHGTEIMVEIPNAAPETGPAGLGESRADA